MWPKVLTKCLTGGGLVIVGYKFVSEILLKQRLAKGNSIKTEACEGKFH